MDTRWHVASLIPRDLAKGLLLAMCGMESPCAAISSLTCFSRPSCVIFCMQKPDFARLWRRGILRVQMLVGAFPFALLPLIVALVAKRGPIRKRDGDDVCVEI